MRPWTPDSVRLPPGNWRLDPFKRVVRFVPEPPPSPKPKLPPINEDAWTDEELREARSLYLKGNRTTRVREGNRLFTRLAKRRQRGEWKCAS